MRKAIAALAVLLLCACAGKAPQLHGTVLSPPPPAHGFTLRDQHGEPYSLDQSHGQAVALYFGFTHCEDVCPQTLALLGKARSRAGLTPQQLRIVMVSVDPARDTGTALQRFFDKAGVQATGLSGTGSQLQAVYKAYGIAVVPQKHDIGHTGTIFLIDSHGRLRELLDPAAAVTAVAADLRAIVD